MTRIYRPGAVCVSNLALPGGASYYGGDALRYGKALLDDWLERELSRTSAAGA